MTAALNWNDPAACKAWLDDIAAHVDDALDAADDQTRPLGMRRLGPASARDLLAEAKEALRSQIAYARRGLEGHDVQRR